MTITSTTHPAYGIGVASPEVVTVSLSSNATQATALPGSCMMFDFTLADMRVGSITGAFANVLLPLAPVLSYGWFCILKDELVPGRTAHAYIRGIVPALILTLAAVAPGESVFPNAGSPEMDTTTEAGATTKCLGFALEADAAPPLTTSIMFNGIEGFGNDV